MDPDVMEAAIIKTQEAEIKRLTEALAAAERESAALASQCVAELEALKSGTLARAETAEREVARLRQTIADAAELLGPLAVDPHDWPECKSWLARPEVTAARKK